MGAPGLIAAQAVASNATCGDAVRLGRVARFLLVGPTVARRIRPANVTFNRHHRVNEVGAGDGYASRCEGEWHGLAGFLRVRRRVIKVIDVQHINGCATRGSSERADLRKSTP